MSTEFFKKYQTLLLSETEMSEIAPVGNQVQVTFVNSGYGITGDEKPQMVEKLGLDIGPSGAPVMYVRSPTYGDKMRADWDARNNRWIVDQD
jgi:hypothetical protein